MKTVHEFSTNARMGGGQFENSWLEFVDGFSTGGEAGESAGGYQSDGKRD